MARITVDDCIKYFPNRFELTLAATNRARQIALGAAPLVETDADKPTVIALREIATGKVGRELLHPAGAADPDPVSRIPRGRRGNRHPTDRLPRPWPCLASSLSQEAPARRTARPEGPDASELTAVARLPQGRGHRADRAAYEVARAAHSGPVPQQRRALHHPPARGGEDPRRMAPRPAGDDGGDPARRGRGHAHHQERDLASSFGKPVAELVDGVSKIDRIEFATLQHAQAENFRKMLLAMARDVRVILIKLADRLHNMRTLEAVPAEKQERIARETLDIYAPIANRLGLNALYYELEDLGFRYLHPNALPRAREGAASARAATGATPWARSRTRSRRG